MAPPKSRAQAPGLTFTGTKLRAAVGDRSVTLIDLQGSCSANRRRGVGVLTGPFTKDCDGPGSVLQSSLHCAHSTVPIPLTACLACLLSRSLFADMLGGQDIE